MKQKVQFKRAMAFLLCAMLVLPCVGGFNVKTVKASSYDRETVSLNGIWEFYPDGGTTRYDIQVPSYWDTPEEYGYPSEWRDLTYGVYETTFTVPSSMADSEVFLGIDAISALGEVYVNGYRVGGDNTLDYLMMMLPYEIDVTDYVEVGEENSLEVHIYGSDAFPSDALSSSGDFLVPVGTEFIDGIGRRGICGDVELISKPIVNISDVQIITDLNQNTDTSDDTITIYVTVDNNDSSSQTVTVTNTAALQDDNNTKTFTSQSVTIAANSSATISVSDVSWTDASYWWIHDPEVYELTTTLVQNSTTVDTLDTTFGFREFYCVSGENYFELNGIRCNLRGDSVDFLNSERNRYYVYDSYIECPSNATTEIVEMILDAAQDLNMNVIRNHIRSFVADEIFDYADDIGMMIIAEAPFWETNQNMDYGDTAISNCCEWVKQWVKSVKNHPSIIMYSTTNEAWGTSDDTVLMPALHEAVETIDTTRPIYNDGEGSDLDCHDAVNYHYSLNGTHMAGYPSVINNSDIYSVYYAGTTKPYGEGEAMTPSKGLPTLSSDGTLSSAYGASFYGDEDSVSRATYVRAVGRITRGARYSEVADWRPFCDIFFCFEPFETDIDPQWTDMTASGLKPSTLTRALFNPFDDDLPSYIEGDGYEYYQNSFAPVAAFDMDYDNDNMIGAEPTICYSGDTLTRSIVVYNDELYDGTSITVNWEASYKEAGMDTYTTITSGSFDETVDYGEHEEDSISFTIPSGITDSQQLYLTLSTTKNSTVKFTEENYIGVINSVPDPILTITNSVVDLGTIDMDDYSYKHRIKLLNTGGGLTEEWTATGYGDWLNLETTSGTLRGEQEVYFTINVGMLEDDTDYSKVLTFTGVSGTSATVTVTFSTGTLNNSDNLAEYAGVEASSSYESSSWGAANAVDGQKDSISGQMGWTSNGSLTTSHTEYITVDLGTTNTISTVDLFPRNDDNCGYGFPEDFTIAVSTDNSTWTTVVEETDYDLPGNRVQRFTFTDVSTRYVKITGTTLRSNPNDSDQYRMQFAEIAVYEEVPMSSTSASASSTYETVSWGIANVIDGITESIADSSIGWTSNNNLTTSHEEYLTIDLGLSKTISGIDLYPRNDSSNVGYGFPVDFAILVSEDNSTWTTVVEETDYDQPSNEVQRFTFTEVTARYVKIDGTELRSNANDSNQYRMQFAEVEVY